MATRLYLSSTAAAAVAPDFDAAWDDIATAVRRECATEKSLSGAAFFDGGGGGAGPQDVLLGQFVSQPLAAQTISGTVKGQVKAQEGDGLVNAHAQLVTRVVSGDGGTVRGTLIAAQAEALSSEFSTSSQNRKFPLAALSPVTVTPVAAQEGDRLVIEVGARSGDNGQDLVRLTIQDNQGSDLPEDETSTATANPWIEFSADIALLGAGEAPDNADSGLDLGLGLGV